MPQISKVGLGWGGSEDYVTLSAWDTAEKAIDYGSKIVALCKGDCGVGATLTTTRPHGAEIFTHGVKYDGSNNADLAFAKLFACNAPDVHIHDMHFILNNALDDGALAFNSLDSDGSIAEDIHISTPFANGTTHLLRIGALTPNLKLRRITVDGNNVLYGVYHLPDDSVDLSGITVINCQTGLSGSSNAMVHGSLITGNTTDINAAGTTITNCATGDTTGNHTGYTKSEMIDPDNGDYRIKSTSDLYGLRIGSYYEDEPNTVYHPEVLPAIAKSGVTSACAFTSLTDIDYATGETITYDPLTTLSNFGIDAEPASTHAVSIPYFPLRHQTEGAMVFVIEPDGQDPAANFDICRITGNAQEYFILSHNRDRDTFAFGYRRGGATSGDFVMEDIGTSSGLNREHVLIISWVWDGSVTTFTLSSKYGKTVIPPFTNTGLWMVDASVDFSSSRYNVNAYYALGYNPTTAQLDEILANPLDVFDTDYKRLNRATKVKPFTIGTGGNYATLAAHRTAERYDLDHIHKLTVIEDQIDIPEVRYFDGEFAELWIVGDLGSFNGDSSAIRKMTASGNQSVIEFSGIATLENIYATHSSGSAYAIDARIDSNVSIRGSYVEHSFRAIGVGSADWIIYNSVVRSTGEIGVATVTSTDDKMHGVCNSLVIGNSTSAAIRANNSPNFSLFDVMAYNENTAVDFYTGGNHTFVGMNNVSSDTSAVDVTPDYSLSNQPLTNWFNDAPNGDWRINATGQTALTKTAYAGGNTLEWLWISLDANSPISPVTKTINWDKIAPNVGITPVDKSLNWDKFTQGNTPITVDKSLLWDIRESIVPVSLPMNWIKLASFQKIQTINWEKRSNIQPINLIMGYNKLGYISPQSKPISWDKRANFSPISKQLNWDKETGTIVISKTQTINWVKVENIQKDLSLSWQINENISPRQIDFRWDKNISVSFDKTISWNKLQNVQKQLVLGWEKYNYKTSDLQLSWIKNGEVLEPFEPVVLVSSWYKLEKIEKYKVVYWLKAKLPLLNAPKERTEPISLEDRIIKIPSESRITYK